MSSRSDVGIVHSVVAMVAIERTLYAVREDGAVFALLRSGQIDPTSPTLAPAPAPRWLPVVPVPGTMAAYERAAAHEATAHEPAAP